MLWGKGNDFPIECEARLPVKACTFVLERQTALFRSLVDEARLFFYHTTTHNTCSCQEAHQPVLRSVMWPSELLVSPLLPYVMHAAHASEPSLPHLSTKGHARR